MFWAQSGPSIKVTTKIIGYNILFRRFLRVSLLARMSVLLVPYCNSPDNVEDDDEEGGDDEVVGADGPTAPEHDYPGHRSVRAAESLHFPHCCNKLERGGKKALRWMERVI